MERKPHLRIAVTSDCNFNCRYCKKGGEGVFSEVEMTLEELVEVAQLSYDVGFRHVKITGGEPLLRQNSKGDVFEFISKLSDIGYSDIQMVTNGYYLKEFADDIVASKLNSLTVSLDTIDKNTYKTIVQNDSLEIVIDGIKLLSNKIPIHINTVVYNQNKDLVFD